MSFFVVIVNCLLEDALCSYKVKLPADVCGKAPATLIVKNTSPNRPLLMRQTHLTPHRNVVTLKPRYNEPIFNENPYITNYIVEASISKNYGKEPRHDEAPLLRRYFPSLLTCRGGGGVGAFVGAFVTGGGVTMPPHDPPTKEKSSMAISPCQLAPRSPSKSI